MDSIMTLNIGDGAIGRCFRDVEGIRLPEGIALVMPCQTHTANVEVVTDSSQTFPETDALITQLPGVAVGVRTADCVPILLYAPDIMAVAAVHAGWKGTVGNIVGNTIDRLVSLGADVNGIRAAFGPSICGECYETGPELAEKFKAADLADAVIYGYGTDPLGEGRFDESTVRIDLRKANTLLMTREGIPATNITHSTECTRHSPLHWPSWRRETGTSSRLATVIHLI